MFYCLSKDPLLHVINCAHACSTTWNGPVMYVSQSVSCTQSISRTLNSTKERLKGYHKTPCDAYAKRLESNCAVVLENMRHWAE